MESQYTDGGIDHEGGRVRDGSSRLMKEVAVANNRGRKLVRGWDLFFRFLALALSLSAAVVLGVDKQTKTVSMTLIPTLPPINVPATAKWHDLSAFVYFVAANAIACTYAAISLLLALANRDGKKGIATIIAVLDLMMVALLFSSVGAALSVGLIGYEGNSHVRWKKVCNVFGKFCNQGASAIALSSIASLLFFLLVAHAILNRNKSR